MVTRTVQVPNISCGHCVATIERELAEVPGVQRVRADAETKRVELEWEPPADWPQIRELLGEIGYPPAEG